MSNSHRQYRAHMDLNVEYYPFYEEDSALGYHGAQPGIDIPSNYIDKNIQNEILPKVCCRSFS